MWSIASGPLFMVKHDVPHPNGDVVVWVIALEFCAIIFAANEAHSPVTF